MSTDKTQELLKRFDELWPNLYTVVPGLGQVDARRAVKEFMSEATYQHALYISPAQKLRNEAALIERKEIFSGKLLHFIQSI